MEDRALEAKRAVDWTRQAINLLRNLEGVLSQLIRAWDSFISEDGDIGYFKDTDLAAISTNSLQSLRTIKATFQQLREHQRTIEQLKECCVDFQTSVSYTLPFGRYDRVGLKKHTLILEM